MFICLKKLSKNVEKPNWPLHTQYDNAHQTKDLGIQLCSEAQLPQQFTVRPGPAWLWHFFSWVALLQVCRFSFCHGFVLALPHCPARTLHLPEIKPWNLIVRHTHTHWEFKQRVWSFPAPMIAKMVYRILAFLNQQISRHNPENFRPHESAWSVLFCFWWLADLN